MPLLKLSGTIDTAQFWPHGESDADTVKVSIAGQASPWKYNNKTTRAFDGAIVHGKVRKPVADKQNRVTIRLQGIDAPELHYPPKNYRQPLGESATVALGKLAASIGKQIVPCQVTTQVEKPNDVFDTYGRMVGDVWLTIKGKAANINHWLAKQGWAFPTFYTSMTSDEINQIIELSEAARKSKKNIWRQYSSKIGPLDTTLLFRKNGQPGADKGPVVLPKLFRRLCGWQVAKAKGDSNATTLKAFLDEAKPPDLFYSTKDILEHSIHSATQERLSSVVGSGDVLQLLPKDMTFSEKTSTLVGPDGKKILNW